MALLLAPFAQYFRRRLIPLGNGTIFPKQRTTSHTLVSSPCSKLRYLSSSSSMNNNNNQAVAANTSDSSDDPHPPNKTVRVEIKGRVQGVFYRNWTVENARGLGLKGWVRNRRDGSVEALFSGNPDSVQEMEQRCRRGPPQAVVTGFQVFPSDELPGPGFDKKPTL